MIYYKYINIIKIRKESITMCKKKKPLSKTEFEFMEFIWKHPTGIQSGEIFKHFSQVRSTQSNILKNIVAKGFLTVQQKNYQRMKFHVYKIF